MICKTRLIAVCAVVGTMVPGPAHAQKKHVEIPDDIPYGIELNPRAEQPVFAVCSKQGARVLVSRDDGTTWKQTFLATESQEDGGWHGTFAVYGMASTNGVIGIFSGWGTPGVYLASDDGVNWGHMNPAPGKFTSVWSAAAGNGTFLTSADQWRGMTTIAAPYSTPTSHSVKELLAGGKTHHMISGFGDYEGGRFVIVGDNHHVFVSSDNGQSWQHSRIPDQAGKGGKGQDVVAYNKGVFVVSYSNGVVRSEDGGLSWTFHEPGLKGWGKTWRGLSVVNDEFWLTAKKGSHGLKSIDGLHWSDLPKSTPGGRFVQGDSGTIINVERKRYDIKRSEDGLTWQSVFNAPSEDVTWDTSFAVYEKVNRVER